jgi:hypothetical protein
MQRHYSSGCRYCSCRCSSSHAVLFTRSCSPAAGSLPCVVTMPNDTEAATLRARLEAIIKKVEDAKAQAVAARHHVQAVGADRYSCPSTCVIFVFIVVFPDRGLAARPHRLFDLRRHGHHRTSPSGDRSAQRPPAGEHRPRLLLHQLCQLV